MNKNIVIILFVAVVFGGIALLYYYTKQYTPEYNWEEVYKKNNDQPYGLKVFYDLLDDKNVGITNIKRSFEETLDTTKTSTNYIAIGDHLYIDSLRAIHILKYVENGNNVFIASNSAPLEITRMLLPKTDTIHEYDYFTDSIISVNNKNYETKLSFHYQHLKDTSLYYWSMYGENYIKDTLSLYGFKEVSFVKNNVVCYSFKWGKGEVFIHSIPLLFTNYNLVTKDGFTNVNNMLSHLNDGPIYWDEISNKPLLNSEFGGGNNTQNPLQFLFSHYTLRWGWYLFLITILIYLLVRTKREQRIIPLLQKNTNTTIAYTKAIGVLYFQKGQHKLIANEMYSLLLANVKSRYNIIITSEEELIDSLTAKSGIEKNSITNLFKHFRKVRYSPMANSKDLINLHSAVESYYKNCN
ncbi:MAG: DUF4350 domain-containing protein [Flavobacteriales bacterium]|nr:DUF4350 domain-containing protein [Flavobacteriales bacterium]